MKKLLAILAVTASFASPVFAEAYGQWYDQDGGVCDDGPGSIQFNEGMIYVNTGDFTIVAIDGGYEDTGNLRRFYAEYVGGGDFVFVIDQARLVYFDAFTTFNIVPCETPEPQF